MRLSLLFDAGNTRLKCAMATARERSNTTAIAWDDPDFDATLAQLLDAASQQDILQACIASVAPEPRLARLHAALAARPQLRARDVRTEAEALGIRVAYADPSRFGVDRWLALVAARARGAGPALLVGVGSAMTVDALADEGVHLGGLILAPPEAMRSALIARAPALDVAAGEVVRFATRTEDAVASGGLLACAALVERSAAELARRTGSAPRVLLSGGGAAALGPWIGAHEVVPDLVLEGLMHWAAARAA